MVRHGGVVGLPEFDIGMTGIPPETRNQKWIQLTAVNVHLLVGKLTKEERENFLRQQEQLLAEIAEMDKK